MFLNIVLSIFLIISPQIDKKAQVKELARKGMELISEFKYKEAIEIFDKAIDTDKDCKEAYLGKGIAYYKSGDYDPRRIYPEEIIKRALKIDPDYFDAKVHLGWAFYHKYPDQPDLWGGYFDKLIAEEPVNSEVIFKIAKFYMNLENFFYYDFKKKILPYLNRAYDTGSNNPELYFALGWEYLKQDSLNYALQLYEKGMNLSEKNDNFMPYLDIGIIYFNMDNKEKAFICFDEALKKMPNRYKTMFYDIPSDDSEILKKYVLIAISIKFYTDERGNITEEGRKFIVKGIIYYDYYPVIEHAFLCLLNYNEKEKYLALDKVAERKKFFNDYFMIRDLTQFNDKNEIKERFYDRVDFIMQKYKARVPRGFDDRGEIFIRYGRPDHIHVDWAYNEISEQMDSEIFGQRFLGRTNVTDKSQFINETKELHIRAESWLYTRFDIFFSIDFISKDYGAIYEIGSMLELKSEKLRLFLKERMGIGGIYDILANRIISSADEKSSTVFLEADIMNFEVYRNELIEKSPPYLPVRIEEEPLKYGYKISSFKDISGKTRSEIYYGLNLRNVDFKFNQENQSYLSSIKFRTAFLDSSLNRIITDSVTSVFRSQTEEKYELAVNQLDELVRPGEYTIFIQMENPEGNKLGVYTDKICVDNYNTSELKISDLQYSFKIDRGYPKEKFTKNNLKIIPYPFFEVSKSKPLYLYYEIYNLNKNKSNHTDYELGYEIKLIESEESIFKKLFKDSQLKESISSTKLETGNKSNIFQYTSFDLSNLRPGKYKLVVSVKDLISGKKDEKSDTFILLK